MNTFKEFIAFLSEYVRGIQMQPDMRARMREHLISYADMHEVTDTAQKQSRVAIFEKLNLRVFQAGFAVVLVAVSAGGVAYASEDTLPGDTLYAVKVRVVEPLESALLTDAKTRATWNAILAERRLSEAATLASRGTLDEATRSDLETRFAIHAERSNEAADEVREEGDIAVALAVHSDLEARLTAHADLFSYLAESEATPEARKLLSVVAATRNRVAAERQEVETEVAARSLAYGGTQIDAAADHTEEVARTSGHSDDAAAGNIDARLVAARSAISSARASLAKDERGIAYVATQAAARFTHEASILAKNRNLIAFVPARDTSEKPSVAPAAKERPAQAARPVDTAVMLMSAPVMDTVSTTTTEATTTQKEVKEEDVKDNEEVSQSEEPSPEPQKEESVTEPVHKTIRSTVRSILGL